MSNQPAPVTQRAFLRALFRQSFYAFMSAVISRRKTPNLYTSRTFKPVCDFMQRVGTLGMKRVNIRDPRNHCKTTTTTIGWPLWLMIQRPDERYDTPGEVERATRFLEQNPYHLGPDHRILLVSGSKENVVACSRLMKTYLESDEFFRSLFPELCPDLAGEDTVWRDDMWTPAGRREPHPQPFITCAGMTSRSTMKHVTTIILDDPVNEENWRSQAAIDSAIIWLKLAYNLLEVASHDTPRGSTIVVTGNKWSDWDVSSYIEENMPDYRIWHRACWVCSHCGRSLCRQTQECSFTDEPLWPEQYTRDGLLSIKRDQGPEIFSAQFENNPINAETARFSVSQCGEFTLDTRADGSWVLRVTHLPDGSVPSSPRIIPLGALRGVLSLDPATSTDPRSCNSALWVLGEDPSTGAVYALDLWAEHADPSTVIGTLLDMFERWRSRGLRIMSVGFESVAGQKYILPALNSTAALRGVGALARSDSPLIALYRTDRGETKEERISRLLRWRVESGLLYIRTDLPNRALFEYEFDRFPGAKTNDTVDALAYAEQSYSRAIVDFEEVKRVRTHLARSRLTRLPF